MRVLQVTDRYAPATGGTEQHVRGLARGLAEAGHDVAVVTGTVPGHPATAHDGAVRIERIAGLHHAVRRWAEEPDHPYQPPAVDPILRRRVREFVRVWKPDVVHAHGWALPTAAAALRDERTPLVGSLHDHGLTCAVRVATVELDGALVPCPGPALGRCLACASRHYGASLGTATVLALRDRRWVRRVDRFLAASHGLARAAGRDGLLRGRLDVVGSYLPQPAPPPGRARFVPETGPYLLFAGAVAAHKGVPELLDAYRQLAAEPVIGVERLPPLILVGRVQEPSVVRTPPAGVTVVGEAPHLEVRRAMRDATAVVVPSTCAEGFGLVAVEAMALGRPVVASRVGGLAETVVDGRTGLLVEPGDPRALAAALAGLLADPDRAESLGSAGRRRAATFDALSAVQDIYAELVPTRLGGRSAAVAVSGSVD